MNQNVKDFLNISRREMRGLVVLFVLMIVIYISPFIWERWFSKPLSIRIETLKPLIAEIKSHNYSHRNYEEEMETAFAPANVKLFKFDPNNLPIEDWVRLGLSEKQALTIKRYEAKGGKFYKKEDVKKMYSISDKQYARLEPYINIPEKSFYSKALSPEYKRPEVKRLIVNLNQADSLSLLDVKGIGPAFASRIIKYRNRLGGFVSKDQLKEIYGIDSLKFNQIQEQLIIDSENIRYININEVTFEELKRFPYLTYKQINLLLAYRKQHGPYKNIADLSKIVSFNQDLISKITPYIKFND